MENLSYHDLLFIHDSLEDSHDKHHRIFGLLTEKKAAKGLCDFEEEERQLRSRAMGKVRVMQRKLQDIMRVMR